MRLTCDAGGMAGGFFATNLGATSVAGVEGWRCAFYAIAAVSIVTAALVAWLAVDPRLSLRVRVRFHNLVMVALVRGGPAH